MIILLDKNLNEDANAQKIEEINRIIAVINIIVCFEDFNHYYTTWRDLELNNHVLESGRINQITF